MKPSVTINFFLAFTFCSWSALVSAQYEGYSTSRLLTELDTIMSQARTAESEIKASLARRDQFARELQDINRERDSYQRDSRRYQDELARHNDAVDRFNAQCQGGSYSRQELTRCENQEADLKQAQTELNAQLHALEEARMAISQRTEDYNNREQERAALAEAQLTRYDDINATINAMIDELGSKPELAGSPCFAKASREATHQCLAQQMRVR